jgi:hypothetical protein
MSAFGVKRTTVAGELRLRLRHNDLLKILHVDWIAENAPG